MVVAVGIKKHLKVVILEDDRVMLGQGRPNMRLFQLGGNIKVVFVPQHLGAGAKPRRGLQIAFNIRKVFRPRRVAPRALL